MALDVETIEDAIVTALAESDDLSDSCPTIAAYGGQLDSLVRESGSLSTPLPAVFVFYAGSAFSEPANRSYDEELTFTCVVVVKSLRGRPDLRTGAYAILDLVRSVLIDSDLDLNIEPIHPLSVQAQIITEEMAIYAFDFKTSQSLD